MPTPTHYFPTDDQRSEVKISMDDGRHWAMLPIEERDHPHDHERHTGWTYRSNTSGDRATVALLPTEEGLETAMDKFANTIYPGVQFLSGITAKSILDELQSKQPRDKGSERIESQRALKTLSTEYTPIRVSVGARFQPLYLTQTEIKSDIAGRSGIRSQSSYITPSEVRQMKINDSDYIGSVPSALGLTGNLTGTPACDALDTMTAKLREWKPTWEMDRGRKSAKIVIGTQVPARGVDGSSSWNTVICRVVEPTEEELRHVDILL